MPQAECTYAKEYCGKQSENPVSMWFGAHVVGKRDAGVPKLEGCKLNALVKAAGPSAS